MSDAFIQSCLLNLYSAVRKTGFLSSPVGKVIFNSAYDGYKRLLEARTLSYLEKWVTPDSIVIDVGANAGFFTVQFAKWLGPQGAVIAIEPEANNVTRLQKAIKKQNCEDRVTIIQAVAAEKAGMLRLCINPDHPGDHRIGDSGIAIPAVTLDELVKEQESTKISFIKIDVQGAEIRVLRGAREILERHAPAMFVEVDPTALAAQGGSLEQLEDILSQAKYTMFILTKGGRHHPITLDDLRAMTSELGTYVDVLCLPSQRNERN
ncbi:MAG: FkbM family methyltransferase [Rhodospirillales bacterium]|nr:FkbM family methyltransferase [Rhodospirillales bacterium]